MREIIQKVIATENEAKQQLAAAKAEAGRLEANARLQARQQLDDAHAAGKHEAAAILAAAEAGAAREKAGQLAQVTTEINATLRWDATMTRQIVAAALAGITRSPPAAAPGLSDPKAP